MAQNKIELDLELHDKFHEVMHRAMEQTEKMEGHMERIKELGLEIAGALGITTIAFEGFELLKEGMAEYKNINIQAALLTNELKNQGKYSKELVDNLKEGRETLTELGFFKEGEQFKFQRELMKQFPNANDEYRNQYTTNAANIAASKGISLAEAQEEESRIIALRPTRDGAEMPQLRKMVEEFGPNFWEANKTAIMNAASHGQNSYVNFMTELLGKAPNLINAAKTKKENDPEAIFNQQVEDFTKHLGELGTKIKKAFLPDMEKAVKWLDDIITNNFENIKNYAILIGRGLESVIKNIDIIAGLLAAKKLIDGFVWLNNIFDEMGKTTKISATALMNVTAEVVNINGVISGNGVIGAAEGVVGAAEGAAATGAVVAGTGAATVGAVGAAGTGAGLGAAEIGAGSVLADLTGIGIIAGISYGTYKALEHRNVPSGMYADNKGELHKKGEKMDYANSDVLKDFNAFITDDKKVKEAIAKHTKEEANAKIKANAGVKNGTDSSTVKGEGGKQIIINIKELVHDFKIINESGNLKESAAEIERIVTEAILNGLQAGQQLSH